MTVKAKVKVIKRIHITDPQEPMVSEGNSKRAAAREVVSTVTNWVSDFQTRKRDETKAAIDKFLSHKPQPSES